MRKSSPYEVVRSSMYVLFILTSIVIICVFYDLVRLCFLFHQCSFLCDCLQIFRIIPRFLKRIPPCDWILNSKGLSKHQTLPRFIGSKDCDIFSEADILTQTQFRMKTGNYAKC